MAKVNIKPLAKTKKWPSKWVKPYYMANTQVLS